MKRLVHSALLCACVLFTPLARAAVPSPAPAPAPASVPADPTPVAPALTAQDASAWLDGMVPFALRQGDLAGGVVVVVKDGAILAAKGYGYADVASKRMVDAERTLFRPGSVSKLITWTAVMQLVEQQKINLDQDINTYLDFKIEPYQGKPLTMRHLMTHTAGFEERIKNLILSDPAKLQTNAAWLKAWTPTRVFAPGTVPAYSNYGAALAGYIVERVAGMPFDDYVERHVFAPLGMQRSSFRQPLPAALAPDMATGYQLASKAGKGFEYVVPAPAGSLSASGADMGRFMIAHLQQGGQGTARILRPETAQQMHNYEQRAIPALVPMALGFYRADRNGQRMIAHGGDLEYFHSDLVLLPAQQVGIFVSFNGVGADSAVRKLREGLVNGFVDRYFPAPPLTITPLATEKAHGALMVGHYQNSRGAVSNFMALTSIFPQPSIQMDDDGALLTPDFKNLAGQPRRWRETAPFVWTDTDNGTHLAAIVKDGVVSAMSFDDLAPIMSFHPIGFGMASPWNLPLLCACMAVLLVASLLWPVGALRRRFGGPAAAPQRSAAALRWFRLSRVAALVHLLFYAGWGWVVLQFAETAVALGDPLDTTIRLIQLTGVAAVLLIPAALMNAWHAWQDGGWWRKLNATALALVCMATLWYVLGLKLLGLHLNY